MSDKPTVVGITGPFGSGKTSAAKFFQSLGFSRITLSSFLEKELKEQEKEITRKNLQDLGNEWRIESGSGILANKALKFASEKNLERLVVDGIRNLGEIEEFKNNSEFILLGVFADRDVRFARVRKMPQREELTREMFDQLDYRDLGITEEKETGLQVAKCFAISDYFIDSNDEANFENKLKGFLEKI